MLSWAQITIIRSTEPHLGDHARCSPHDPTNVLAIGRRSVGATVIACRPITS
jgi:hypothetical protein